MITQLAALYVSYLIILNYAISYAIWNNKNGFKYWLITLGRKGGGIWGPFNLLHCFFLVLFLSGNAFGISRAKVARMFEQFKISHNKAYATKEEVSIIEKMSSMVFNNGCFYVVWAEERHLRFECPLHWTAQQRVQEGVLHIWTWS